jgi:L-asparaginase
VIATGGSIAMVADAESGRRSPTLSGAELAAMIPELGVPLEHFQPYAIGSEDATFEHWFTLAQTIGELAEQHHGIVVTHGTDTMEEAAYFVNECLPDVPVAFCGAMRPPGSLGYDGRRNLLDAITVARSPLAPVLGTVVVMNRELLPAWDVAKLDSVDVGAFGTRHGTRVATVHDGELRLLSLPLRFNWLGTVPEQAPDPEAVAYVRLSGSPSPRQFAQAVAGATGVVVDSLGAGFVPEAVRAQVLSLAGSVPVVLTTRTLSGPVQAEQNYPHAWDDLLEAGVVLERRLDGPRARIRLSLSFALGRGYERLEPVVGS